MQEGDPRYLIECDTCPYSFHSHCAGMERGFVPEGRWSCPVCTVRMTNARPVNLEEDEEEEEEDEEEEDEEEEDDEETAVAARVAASSEAQASGVEPTMFDYDADVNENEDSSTSCRFYLTESGDERALSEKDATRMVGSAPWYRDNENQPDDDTAELPPSPSHFDDDDDDGIECRSGDDTPMPPSSSPPHPVDGEEHRTGNDTRELAPSLSSSLDIAEHRAADVEEVTAAARAAERRWIPFRDRAVEEEDEAAFARLDDDDDDDDDDESKANRTLMEANETGSIVSEIVKEANETGSIVSEIVKDVISLANKLQVMERTCASPSLIAEVTKQHREVQKKGRDEKVRFLNARSIAMEKLGLFVDQAGRTYQTAVARADHLLRDYRKYMAHYAMNPSVFDSKTAELADAMEQSRVAFKEKEVAEETARIAGVKFMKMRVDDEDAAELVSIEKELREACKNSNSAACLALIANMTVSALCEKLAKGLSADENTASNKILELLKALKKKAAEDGATPDDAKVREQFKFRGSLHSGCRLREKAHQGAQGALRKDRRLRIE
jgi:hypothetical protein